MSGFRGRRGAFTLLELLLASGIALLLMAGLYVAMEVNLKYAAAGREVVEESELARALLRRISTDISGALTPISATKSIAATSGTTVTDDATPMSFSSVMPLNMGVAGDNLMLTIYTSRVPRLAPNITQSTANADQQQLGFSDLRRVTYWLSNVGDGGLARQEVDRVTADPDGDTQLPPGVTNEDRLIIAPEVTNVVFHYFDGTAWQDTWDGSILGPDGATPVGPPRAIEIILDVRRPGARLDDPTAIRTYRHVVAINSANAQSISTTDTGTGTGTTTTPATTQTGGGS